jgi:hypothetical protein
MAPKHDFITALDKLPDDATVEDILQQIYVVLKVERGLDAARAGKKVPLEEVRRRVKSWSK